ncbi:nucleoside diphosphate kinase A [Pteropus vampyrus]|uniref:Nucleoside diphosphate kinase n=1 Tax=Pteropus vampyrus TaxID=132908 RepID=A0A6P3QHT0_PTEVA|nr:nucleoside diphosphate kinase A [Pteropus vampyrus]
MANSERTFIAIKPDGVQRQLVGEIIKRFEQKGFRLVAMKFMQASEDLLKEHYIDLKDRPFFASLVKYMHSGPVVAMVWEGLNVVKTGRVMLGETNPADSKPGTIRGDFCIQVGRNIIHGSDSMESAEKEIGLWFQPEELVEYKKCAQNWIYECPFYPGLVKYMNSGPVVAMVWEGLNVVKTGRMMLGETNPADSKPGTIRGDFCIQVGRNIIHGSDSVKSAEREISLWFKPEELVDYKSCAFNWIYE